MLTGRRAFPGDDVTEVLAGIIKDEPDWALVPPEGRRMLEACLRKDARARLRDIGDAFELLDETASPAPSGTTVKGRSWWMVAATTTAALLLAAAFAAGVFRDAPPPGDPVRFQIAPPAQGTILSLAVSPDGKRIAVVVRQTDNEARLWTRSLDALEFRPHNVRVSPGAVFWSPDSRFVALWDRGQMKKVDVSGGTTEVLAAMTVGDAVGVLGLFRGGAWNRDGTIIFGRGPIVRIPASGGEPVQVTRRPDSVREYHAYPSFLPDGQRFLYLRESPNAASSGVFVGDIRLSPEEQNTTRVLPITSAPIFVPGATPQSGHLLFIRNGSLMTQRFDADRLESIGEALKLADDMADVASPLYSASSSGVLAFRRGAALSEEKRLLIHDRSGTVVGQIGAAADYRNVMLSPDGRFVAVDIAAPQQSVHVWAGSVARGVLSRLTTGDTPDMAAAVSSTGQVAFSYALDGALGDLDVATINRADPPEPWVKSDEQKHLNHFSHDGRFLIYDSHHATRRQDLWIVPTTGDRKPIPFLTTPADETFGQFSPDGRWVAYSSDETGRRDVYVQGFAPDRQPATGVGKWTVSTAGGDKPRWSADGKELFYLAPDGRLMAVPVKLNPTFEPGLPMALFATRATSFVPYDVTPDGRFVIITIGGNAAQSLPPIDVVLNWQPSRTE
jgi:Tol biopolymer transport system component